MLENDATRLFVYAMTIEDTTGHLFYFSSSYYFATCFDLKKVRPKFQSLVHVAQLGNFKGATCVH